MIHLLDTDHVSVLQRGGADAVSLANRLRQIPPDDIGTTIVTYEEQCRGWLDAIHRAGTADQRVAAYGKLTIHLRFFSSIAVCEYTASAENFAVTLEPLRMGTKDRRIAAIALANDATILTRNVRDFEKVPGLRVEDWTVSRP